VALLGVVAGAVVIGRTVIDYGDRIDGFDRVEVPGTMNVELGGTGGYSIYHEYDGAYDEEAPFGEEVDPRDLLLVRRPTVTVRDLSGNELALEAYDTKVSYSTDLYEGIGLYTFHVDDPGTYEVETSGDTAPGGSVIAVGRGVSAGVITGVITGLLIGFVGVVAGVVTAIVLAVRRGRNRRSQMRSGLPPGLPPYATYGPPMAWPPAGYGMQPSPSGPGVPGAPGGPMPPDQPAPGPTGPPPLDAPPQRPAAPPPSPPPAPQPPSGDTPSQPGSPPAEPPPPSVVAAPPAPRHTDTEPDRGPAAPPSPTGSAPAAPPFRDPPSLRARDWSRDDLSLPWSPDQR
jgi:hypothetical protein